MTDDAAVLVERRGVLGMLTLNRPRSINALTHEMVDIVARTLDEWSRDDAVTTVLITGVGERGLCAGGDIVSLYAAATSGDYTSAAQFWADEYRLNAQLASFVKPVVAIQDGIVLGGGIGISAHCSHRIVTERSRLGLPEVGIGFVPDVGSTWLLARSPGELGTAVALSGLHVDGADAIALGLADVFVPSKRLDALISALAAGDVDEAIASVSAESPESRLATGREWIDRAFVGDDVLVILARARRAGEPAARILAGIERSSPAAVTVALAALRRAASETRLEDALIREYRTSLHALSTADFAEGVRAQVIDKDRNPAWVPRSFDGVDSDIVAPYFSAPLSGDLELSSKEMS